MEFALDPKPTLMLSLLLPVALLFIVSLSYFLAIDPVLAHREYQFGNITLEAGWVIEPPLVGQLNGIEVIVTQKGGEEGVGAENGTEPIRNAFANLNTEIKFGGLTKSLQFQPSEESAAIYTSEIIPTSIGSYSLVFDGQIERQNISTAIPIEDVESTDKLEFPQSEASSIMTASARPSSTTALDTGTISTISAEIRDIITEVSDQLTELREESNATRQAAMQALNSIEGSKSMADRAYVAGMIGIGTGIAGIVLALFLTRKVSPEESKRISPKRKGSKR